MRATSSSINDAAAFLDDYSAYVATVVKPTKRVVDETLAGWQSIQADVTGDPLASKSPVALIESRIKSPESASDKIRRKREVFPAGLCLESLELMTDMLGCRVVVYFPSDLALIHEIVETSSDFELLETPTAYYPEDRLHAVGLDEDIAIRGKVSGYRSIHYILRQRSDTTSSGPPFELQVRTLTDNVWAAIEHFLAYKPASNIPVSIRKQFELLAAHMGVIDAHFDLLNDEIQRLQQQTKLRKRDPLSLSTLPLVLKEFRVGVRQRDLDRMLKMLASNGIRTVEELRIIARELSPERIANTYRGVFHKAPRNFTIVAIWALYAANQRTGGPVDPTALVTLAEQYASAYRELQ